MQPLSFPTRERYDPLPVLDGVLCPCSLRLMLVNMAWAHKVSPQCTELLGGNTNPS